MTTTVVASGSAKRTATLSATYQGTSSPDEVLQDNLLENILDSDNGTLVVEFGIYIAPGTPPATTVIAGSGKRTATLNPA